MISCIQAACEMDMAYHWKKKQKMLPACVVTKIEDVFPPEQFQVQVQLL